jgi:hypothetical protein
LNNQHIQSIPVVSTNGMDGKENWFYDKRDLPWDVLLPCFASYNKKHRDMINTRALILDESMSGWHPKTSKLGGLPNFTFQPRKHVPLVTMFRTGDEWQTGSMTFQDIAHNAEVQKEKSFYGEDSSLSSVAAINAPCVEVLPMIEGSNLE